jgi:hypothetical protein
MASIRIAVSIPVIFFCNSTVSAGDPFLTWFDINTQQKPAGSQDPVMFISSHVYMSTGPFMRVLASSGHTHFPRTFHFTAANLNITSFQDFT